MRINSAAIAVAKRFGAYPAEIIDEMAESAVFSIARYALFDRLLTQSLNLRSD
jgi:hypothetical protein